MAWTEPDIRKEGDGELIASESENLKALGSPNGGTVAVHMPALKSLQVKDVLSYANTLRTRNKFLDAVVLYDNLISKDKTNAEAYVGKGICLQLQNSLREALECYDEAIRLDPQNACALTHRGLLFKDEGHLVEAAEVLFSNCIFYTQYLSKEFNFPWRSPRFSASVNYKILKTE